MTFLLSNHMKNPAVCRRTAGLVGDRWTLLILNLRLSLLL